MLGGGRPADGSADAKRVVAEGYDRRGPAFSAWEAENPMADRARRH